MLSQVGAECLKLINQFLEGKITKQEMIKRADVITNCQGSLGGLNENSIFRGQKKQDN